MPKLSALQSFALWATTTTVIIQSIGISNGNSVDTQVSAFFFTVGDIWPLWFAWRFAKFLWRFCSLISMRIEDRLNDARRERAARW